MVKCLKCDWVGSEEDLGLFYDDINDIETAFKGCPNCKTDSCLIDGWIICLTCNKSFKGEEGKEDTCPRCLREILKGGLK